MISVGTFKQKVFLSHIYAVLALACATSLAGCSSESIPSEQPTPSSLEQGSSDESSSAPSGANTTLENLDMFGLIVVTTPSGVQGAGDPPGFFPEVQAFDPVSGSPIASRSFSNSDESVSYAPWYTSINGGWGHVVRRAFSTDYDKVVALKSNVGGSGNVSTIAGYIDVDGRFYDMTSVAPPVKDFDTSTDNMPAFGLDDSFYFTRRPPDSTGGAAKISKLFHISGSTFAEEVVMDESSVAYELRADGTVGVRGAGDIKWLWDSTGTKGCLAPDDMSIDGLCVKANKNRLFVFEAVPYDGSSSFPSPVNERNILPESNTRVIHSPVFSPDGAQIAFLAQDSTGLESFDLYTISVNGGEPTKVEAGQFMSDQRIVEWKE